MMLYEPDSLQQPESLLNNKSQTLGICYLFFIKTIFNTVYIIQYSDAVNDSLATEFSKGT